MFISANIPPTLNISESSQNFIDGCFQVAFGVTSTLILVASDENGDNITLSLTNASTFENVLITPGTFFKLEYINCVHNNFLVVFEKRTNGYLLLIFDFIQYSTRKIIKCASNPFVFQLRFNVNFYILYIRR